MKNVLVTGGAGFIGSNFIHYLLEEDSNINIYNLDLLTYAGNLENLKDIENKENYKFIQGDICSKELVLSLLQDYEIDTLVHFAAESHVDRSISNPSQFIFTNIIGTYTLLEAVRQVSSEIHFHHISTDEVFGTLKEGELAWTEESPYLPKSPYAASKASSDHLVRSYGHTYNISITISNCSNNYGPYQYPEKLIPVIILNALANKPLPIYGDGLQVRDWIYVRDHCDAIYKILKYGEFGESYNIGGNNQPTNLFITQKICGILDELIPTNKSYKELIEFVKDRPNHDRRYDLCFDKIGNELSWEPKYNLEDGLRKTVIWYLNNLDWVQHIKDKSDYKQWINKNYNNR
jgi:dTDP-glucose 4,6-dehydratase